MPAQACKRDQSVATFSSSDTYATGESNGMHQCCGWQLTDDEAPAKRIRYRDCKQLTKKTFVKGQLQSTDGCARIARVV